jgi:phosphoglycolate phosphatase-like HAD superfamily hydrolase
VYPHVTDTNIFKTAFERQFRRQPTETERRDFEDRYVELLVKNRSTNAIAYKEVPFAKQTIDNLLNDDSFVVGIGTGGWLRPAVVKLEHIGVPSQQLLLGAADGHETRLGIINQLMNDALVAEPGITRSVYIGDAVWDVRTTRQLGLNMIGIRRRGDLEFLQNQGVRYVFDNFGDYPSFKEAILLAKPPV